MSVWRATPARRTVRPLPIRADHCIDAKGGEIVFQTANRYTGADYYVDFRNVCGYALDVHSIACYARDGVRAPGYPNGWFYLPPHGSDRQYYSRLRLPGSASAVKMLTVVQFWDLWHNCWRDDRRRKGAGASG